MIVLESVNGLKIQLDRKVKEGRVDNNHRMLAGNKVNLINSYNYQYFGTLWVGSHFQPMTFIFDTGSAWTWIPSEDCPDD